ncbi:MAG: hypothetical protein ACPLKZ_01085 [Candidatus Bathyarchaeales archaeon]
MSVGKQIKLLVGDNPFHGISHLSQERTRNRGIALVNVEYFTNLLEIALRNGADGFMFSVSDVTLSILEALCKKRIVADFETYAIVPYAYEYVRLATQAGGLLGLGKKVIKDIILSGNVNAAILGTKGLLHTDITAFLETYLLYEISRIKTSIGRPLKLNSILLHEVITEIALSLDLNWLITDYISFMRRLNISPGFETRNFAYLVRKFKEWKIDFNGLTIAAPFNKIGFQMNPSREECEKALLEVDGANIIGMSILAAGYFKPIETISYLGKLPNLNGVVVGVSKEQHARETFNLLNKYLKSR